MSTPYAGNPASFPTDYVIPDDGDAIDATSVDVAFEALGDRTAFNKTRLRKFKTQTFTASGTWTAPAGIDGDVVVIGYGGGGGGGSGKADSFNVTDHWQGGGGGGGGALLSTRRFTATGGTPYSVVVGAGGAGGATDSANGADGASSTVGGLIFPGGQGGIGGQLATVSSDYYYAPGGASVAGTVGYVSLFTASSHDLIERSPSFGAAGITSNNTYPRTGCPSPQGFAGGVVASNGSASGSYRGGGAGGSGGAGPGGAGGNASSGGAATGTFGLAGASGGSGSANTGAGGGGSGAQGSGPDLFPETGTGGDGGSGQITLIWTEFGTL